MALRDQPYMPLYVQDFQTDEKLIECSASATGIYIRIMCVLHKSDEYGTILLKQKDKQSVKQVENFALKFAKHLPYPINEIIAGIDELIQEGVLQIDGDMLFQKRMVKDNKISILRSEAGKTGGLKTQFAKAKVKAKTKAKVKANYEYEIESVIEDDLKSRFEIFRKKYPGTKKGLEPEYENFCKKNNPSEIIPLLLPALDYQIKVRNERKSKNLFIPEWKNMSTWINQKCWTEEIPALEGNQGEVKSEGRIPELLKHATPA